MSVELEHAEQVLLEHEKQNFAVDKPTKHKEADSHEKYSSLYSSFDELKQHQDDGTLQVLPANKIRYHVVE